MIPAGHKTCEWCSAPLTGNQEVACSTPCRIKRWRWLHGIPVSPSAGVERPPEGSPLLVGSGALRASERRLNGRPGGLQVSANRMVRVLTGDPWVLPEVQARRAVAQAMSDRQRARFVA